eukprot:1257401-Ditylum_brightwellii.AAC.1
MATHATPAFGNVTSFRSLGYGLLSVARFLYHVQKYTRISFPCKISSYIDNKGIFDHTTEHMKYSFDYPYNTLEPDWDVAAQSAVNLCVYGSNLTIHHVKSQQDDNTLYEDLDILTRLNVEADKLTTKCCYLHGLSRKIIPRITINDAQ